MRGKLRDVRFDRHADPHVERVAKRDVEPAVVTSAKEIELERLEPHVGAVCQHRRFESGQRHAGQARRGAVIVAVICAGVCVFGAVLVFVGTPPPAPAGRRIKRFAVASSVAVTRGARPRCRARRARYRRAGAQRRDRQAAARERGIGGHGDLAGAAGMTTPSA